MSGFRLRGIVIDLHVGRRFPTLHLIVFHSLIKIHREYYQSICLFVLYLLSHLCQLLSVRRLPVYLKLPQFFS